MRSSWTIPNSLIQTEWLTITLFATPLITALLRLSVIIISMWAKQAKVKTYQHKPPPTPKNTHTTIQSANRILHVSICVPHNFLDYARLICIHLIRFILKFQTSIVFVDNSTFMNANAILSSSDNNDDNILCRC